MSFILPDFLTLGLHWCSEWGAHPKVDEHAPRYFEAAS